MTEIETEAELLEKLRVTVENNTAKNSFVRARLLQQYSALKEWGEQDHNRILYLLNIEHPNWRGYRVNMRWVDLAHGNCKNKTA